jgi:hypothetical protein
MAFFSKKQEDKIIELLAEWQRNVYSTVLTTKQFKALGGFNPNGLAGLTAEQRGSLDNFCSALKEVAKKYFEFEKAAERGDL